MTIAACYFSSEGIVLGADSTTTTTTAYSRPGAPPLVATRHFDYAQKIFEVGEHGSLGVNMWGNGRIGNVSHRTFIANVSDEWMLQSIASVFEAARFFADRFWAIFASEYAPLIQRYRDLTGNLARTQDEEAERARIEQGLSGGYCLGGTWGSDRTPQAFQILYGPNLTAPPVPASVPIGNAMFWGCPNFIGRLLFGIDQGVYAAILGSGKWAGTPNDLDAIVEGAKLFQHADMPLREAIDFVHATIHATIKALKFSQLPEICGGPIEIAVIASDRRFRWVKHKSLDHALG